MDIKMIDYFKELEKLEEQNSKLSKEYAKLYFQRENLKVENKELDLEIENFNKIKAPVYEKLSELRLSIVNASELDFELMGYYMANVISVFEKESYEFYASYFDVSKTDDEQYETKYFIAPCTLNKSGLTYDFLVQSKDIIVFDNSRYKKIIRFYDFLISRKIHGLDYGRFDYLSDFVKYVINYKLNFNVDIDLDNIPEIMDEFVKIKEKQMKLKLG